MTANCLPQGILLLLITALLLIGSTEETERHVRSLYERGEWAETVRVASQAGSRSAGTSFYEGLALARLGRFEEAEQAFLDGWTAAPRDKRFAIELAGVAYRQQNRAAAKGYLHRALRLDPDDNYANDFLGTLYLLDGNLAAALRYWNRIAKPLVENLLFSPPLDLDPVLRDRTFTLSPGQVFTTARLRTIEANLARLAILADYHFGLSPARDQRFDVTFRSLETAPIVGGRLGKLLPFVRGLPYRTVFVDRSNIGRHAVNFSSLWRWDPNKRRIALDLSGPFRLNPYWRYQLIADARDEHWDLSRTFRGAQAGLDRLRLQRLELGAEMAFGLSARLQWTTGLYVAARRFRNGAGGTAFANSWSFEQRNKMDYGLWTWPERRVRIDTSGRLHTGKTFADLPGRFAVAEGVLKALWYPQSQGEKITVNAAIRAGKTFGSLPFDEYFMLGMERDNDLWLRGHVGTRDGRKGNAPMGTDYTLSQLDVSRTVMELPFFRLQVGPFFDTGRIADPSSQFGSRGWMQDTGLQARIRTIGRMTWTFVYGRDLRDGRGAFYTAVSR